jgi:predicted DNA-binding WGR domain protein
MIAKRMLVLARELVSINLDSPFKTKKSLNEVRRDPEHRGTQVLNYAMSLSPRSKLIDEQLLTLSEGTSHKFHFFALYDDNGIWKAGNAYGRIGAEPKAMMIASGDESPVRSAYQRKIRAKKIKGYN